MGAVRDGEAAMKRAPSPTRRARELVRTEPDGRLFAVRIGDAGVSLVTQERSHALAAQLRRILAHEFRRVRRAFAKRAARTLMAHASDTRFGSGNEEAGLIAASFVVEAMAKARRRPR